MDKADNQRSGLEAVPGSARPLDVNDEALIEAGRQMLVESAGVLRDFPKQMITVSTTAIPIYVGLLGLAGLRHRSQGTLILISLPAFAFLLSALFFTIALLPRKAFVSMAITSEVECAREKLLRRRYKWSQIGLAVFGASIASSVISILALMATTSR